MSTFGNRRILPVAVLTALGVMALSPVEAIATTAGIDKSGQTLKSEPAKKNVASENSSDNVKPDKGPTLSEKLDATNGVIKPPGNVDPEMTQKPPKTGATMPVIPPSAVKPDAAPEKPEAK